MDPERHFEISHHGQVYNITDFLSKHPGGVNYLKPYKGKDITEKMESTQHSKAAYNLLKQHGEKERDSQESEDGVESLIDSNKPIFGQLTKLGERYNEWILLPFRGRMRLFQSDFLENLTFTPCYVSLMFWSPIITYMIFRGFRQHSQTTQDFRSFFSAVLILITGLVIWTIVEYVLHRWIFHIQPSGKWKVMMYAHFLLHGIHHKSLNDPYRVIFPPLPAAAVAAVIFSVESQFFSESVTVLLLAGTLIGSLAHDLVHYYMHFGAPKKGSYFYYLKRCHLQHHYVDPNNEFVKMDPENYFEVTHRGQVYNITDFLRKHPGGVNYLQPYKGKDITEKMESTHHSKAAYNLLKQHGENERDRQESEYGVESLIDSNKPIFGQITKLGVRYNEWVLLPFSGRMRLFESDFLENLTFTPLYVMLMFWSPIITYIIFRGFKQYSQTTQAWVIDFRSVFSAVLILIMGFLIWTIVEYVFHRWIFHIQPSGKSKAMIYVHFLIHGIHHKSLNDPYRVVLPPLAAAALAALSFSVESQFFSESVTLLLLGGNLIGYVTHEVVHYHMHFGAPKKGSYFYYLKRCHLQHHYVDPNNGFGLTSHFWDNIFGSTITLRKLGAAIKW